MERTKNRLPDAVNCSSSTNFTQVSNFLLRNPELSSKAKTVLCILLSNQNGWKSYFTSILSMMKEGESALRSGLKELENYGYLLRIKYRCKKSKIIKGSFWAYTDNPNDFNLQYHLGILDEKSLETIDTQPRGGNPREDNPRVDNQALIILSNKKTNLKKDSSSDGVNGYITISQFDKFWKLYPKKASKGNALIAWNKLCKKKQDTRPTWRIIRTAIREQKKTEQWQDSQFIPLASTWINNYRWLDDPEEMKVFKPKNNKPNTIGFEETGKVYREADETM
jgi:hypothetical protein